MESVNELATEQINEEVYTFSPVTANSSVILDNITEFEQIWNLEKQIFTDELRSTKEDLKDIYDTREILIMSPNGYVIANPLEDVPREEAPDVNWGKSNTLYIFSIGVIPQAKGMGLGKTMLQQVINDSKKPRIALDTTNEVMKQLSLKLGFKQITDTYFVFEKGIVYD
jgi:hypothetical protein